MHGNMNRRSKPKQRTKMSKPLSILLATNHLFDWTGSETLFLSLVNGLWEAGHSPVLYIRHVDKKWLAIPPLQHLLLVDDIQLLANRQFDLAHVQHNSCLLDVRSTFPNIPIIFSCLGPYPFLEQPPPFNCSVTRYLSISEEVRDNLLSKGVSECDIDILPNLVRSKVFYPTKAISKKPKHILVLSNKIDESKKLLLKAAANQIRAKIKFVGGASKQLPPAQLALEINSADIVVTLGRGVIEAMLCARVPLVFDINGGDGLVTPDNIDALQKYNFSGRLHRHNFTTEELVNEFNKYKPDIGQKLLDIAKTRFGLEYRLDQLLKIYSEVLLINAPIAIPDHTACKFSSQLANEDLKLAKLYRIRIDELNMELDRVKQTFSWKITGPLRATWNIYIRLLTIFTTTAKREQQKQKPII